MNTTCQPLPKTLQRCRDGDPRAIEDLFLAYQERIFRLALSILDDGRTAGAADEAEEVAQDVLIAMLAGLDDYCGEASFSTWLYSIALNACRSRLRKRGSLARMIQGLKDRLIHENNDEQPPEEEIIRHEHNTLVWKAIQSLDEKHRLPVILHYYHDLSVKEIAEVMNLPTGTVLSRLYSARVRLRLRLPTDICPTNTGGDPQNNNLRQRGME